MRPLRGYINIMLSRIERQKVEKEVFATGEGEGFIVGNSDGSKSERSLGTADNESSSVAQQ